MQKTHTHTHTHTNRSLPSNFDYYPAVKKLADSLHSKGDFQEGVKLLKCLKELVSTGNSLNLDAIVSKHSVCVELGDEEVVSANSDAVWQVAIVCFYVYMCVFMHVCVVYVCMTHAKEASFSL